MRTNTAAFFREFVEHFLQLGLCQKRDLHKRKGADIPLRVYQPACQEHVLDAPAFAHRQNKSARDADATINDVEVRRMDLLLWHKHFCLEPERDLGDEMARPPRDPLHSGQPVAVDVRR